jgi:hypothetical protein
VNATVDRDVHDSIASRRLPIVPSVTPQRQRADSCGRAAERTGESQRPLAGRNRSRISSVAKMKILKGESKPYLSQEMPVIITMVVTSRK